MGGRRILIEQRPFFLILLFDMQILKKSISCVATILLRIVVSAFKLNLPPEFYNGRIRNVPFYQVFQVLCLSLHPSAGKTFLKCTIFLHHIKYGIDEN